MEAIENNGCVGHPVTNLLLGAAVAATAGAEVIDLSAARAAHAEAHTEPGDDDIPAEVLANIEAAFDDLAGKIETGARQVGDTDVRTAHLVLTCERLGRDMVEAHAKLDRIISHFKVA